MSLDTVLLVAGVVLIGLELVVPGGILGAVGFVSMMAGFYAGFYYFLGGGWDAFIIVGGTVAVLAVICALLFWLVPSSLSWNPFVLREKQKNSEGYTGAGDYSAYLGKKGKVIAPLRPAGTAVIDGERVDVVSFGDYINKDAEIEVVKIEGSKLLVKQINN